LPEQVNRNTSRLLQSGHERLTYQPGEVIVREGDVADKFYLITNGEVEVLQSRHGDEVVARLSSGQYFGEIGLLHGGRRAATVRAAVDEDTVVEVVAINRDLFIALLTESNMTRNEIILIMRQRLVELGNADQI
jgi:putative ABC transport system ATP-binding protein